jgi:hypothetical protein
MYLATKSGQMMWAVLTSCVLRRAALCMRHMPQGCIPLDYDFPKQFSDFSFKTLLTKGEVIGALAKIKVECAKVRPLPAGGPGQLQLHRLPSCFGQAERHERHHDAWRHLRRGPKAQHYRHGGGCCPAMCTHAGDQDVHFQHALYQERPAGGV